MKAAPFLKAEREAIVEDAASTLAGRHVRHYETTDPAEVRQRLETLFDHLLTAAESRDLTPIVAYAQQVAGDRFNAGFDLSEVQSAFNVLEEAAWRRVFGECDPGDFAEILGLVATILGAAKDALGRAYVSLATDAHAPSMDLKALFSGSEGT